jgi:hypothetical protein
MVDSAGFFGDVTAEEAKFDRYHRYLLNADGKGDKPYTRATTLAKTTDSGDGLLYWKTKLTAIGMVRRPDLLARASVTPMDDKSGWSEILTQALAAGGSQEKANKGTAYHTFHENVENLSDDEYAAVPFELRATYAKDRAELDRLGMRELATEVTVVNELIGTAGKVDSIYELANGDQVIVDRKSGRVVEYPHGPAQQLAIYANATKVRLLDGTEFVPIGEAFPWLRKDIGLIIDISVGDETTSAVHVYEIDLVAGWYGALLSAKVRRWRNRKDLITPYQPEFINPADAKSIVDKAAKGDPPKVLAAAGLARAAGEDATHLAELAHSLMQPVAGISMPQIVQDAQGVASGWSAGAPSSDEVLNPNGSVTSADVVEEFKGAIPPLSASVREALADPPRVVVVDASGVEWEVPGDVDLAAAGLTPVAEPAPNSVEHMDAALARRRAGTAASVAPSSSDADALLAAFKTKSALQSAARKVDPGMNVSRTRQNLATDMVAHPNWAATRDALLNIDGTVRTEDPWGPTPEQVAKAKEMAATGQLSEFPVVEHVEGDSAAANPFRKAEPTVAPLTPVEIMLGKVAQATDAEQLGDLWEEAQALNLPWDGQLAQAAALKLKTFSN